MSFNVLRRAAFAPASARAFSTSSPRSLARITIVGNLADTPEVRSTNNGREMVRYAVASNSGPAANRKTSWFRVTSFTEGPSRDFLLSLPKGATVFVDGEVSQSNYTDASGNQRTSLNIVQRSIDVIKRPYHANEASEEHAPEHSE